MKLLDDNLIVEGPQGWMLMAQRCEACGCIAFPRKRVCPDCFSEDLADFALSRQGSLHTYALTYLGVGRLPAPYLIGFIDLPEKIRVFGLIECPDGAPVHAGQTMQVFGDTLWRDENGDDIFCYKFRPVAEGDAQ